MNYYILEESESDPWKRIVSKHKTEQRARGKAEKIPGARVVAESDLVSNGLEIPPARRVNLGRRPRDPLAGNRPRFSTRTKPGTRAFLTALGDALGRGSGDALDGVAELLLAETPAREGETEDSRRARAALRVAERVRGRGE